MRWGWSEGEKERGEERESEKERTREREREREGQRHRLGNPVFRKPGLSCYGCLAAVAPACIVHCTANQNCIVHSTASLVHYTTLRITMLAIILHCKALHCAVHCSPCALHCTVHYSASLVHYTALYITMLAIT